MTEAKKSVPTMVYKYPGQHKIARDFFVDYKTIPSDELAAAKKEGWFESPEAAKSAADKAAK